MFVYLFVALLLPQLWDDYIQTCYIGSARPQFVYGGVVIFAGGLGEEGRRGQMQILYVNVYGVVPPPGGEGYYKSPPFTVQSSDPHVFQCSEVF